MKNTIVLIDGSNFYYKLKSLGFKNLLDFNFSGFIKYLCKDTNTAIYYIGKIRTDGTRKAQRLHTEQQHLLERLKKHKVQYKLGYLLKTQGRYHEKGVDVQIAVDILIAAYENLYKNILLISSDTDIIPAIKKSKDLGKPISYIGFKHQPSKALIRESTDHYLLNKSELKQFVKA